MKKFAAVTCGVLVVAIGFDWLLFGNPFLRYTLYVLLVMLAGFLSYPLYGPYLRGGLAWIVNGLLILLTAPVYAAVVWILLMMIVSFPPAEPYEEQLVYEPGPELHQRMYFALVDSFEQFGDEHERALKRFDEDGSFAEDEQADEFSDSTIRVLEETDDLRQAVLEFTTGQQVALPEQLSVSGVNHTDGPPPGWLGAIDLIRVELLHIAWLLEQSEFAEPFRRYQRGWRTLEVLSATEGRLVDHLVVQMLTNQMIDGFEQFEEKLDRDQRRRLLSTVTRVNENLKHQFQQAWVLEYHNARSWVVRIEEGIGEELNRIQRIGWPLFDPVQTRLTFHELFYGLTRLSGAEDPEVAEETARDKESIVEMGWTEKILDNPVGSFVVRAAVPQFTSAVTEYVETRKRLQGLIERLEVEAEPNT